MKTYAFTALCLLMGATACNDEVEDVTTWSGQSQQQTMAAPQLTTRAAATSQLSDYKMIIDKTLTIATEQSELYDGMVPQSIKAEPRSGQCDVHLEILPIYCPGSTDASGDYYAVNGYVLAHNRELFEVKDYAKSTLCGYYMGNLAFGLQLLDDAGQPVTNDAVSFVDTPQPSTTISSWTYTYGYSFSIKAPLTLGITETAADTIAGTNEFSIPLPSYKCNDKASQNLPEQVVEMNTGAFDRSVSYKLQTNHYGGGYHAEDLPSFSWNDQRVDFSFVWFVSKGHYNANDYNEGHMKLCFDLHPQLYANARMVYMNEHGYDSKQLVTGLKPKMNYDDSSFIIDMPTPKRAPVGNFSVQNPSSFYMTDITLWHSGTYGKPDAKPVSSCSDAFGRDQSYDGVMLEGTYDMVFSLRDGNTGELKYTRILRGIEIEGEKSTVTNISTSEPI